MTLRRYLRSFIAHLIKVQTSQVINKSVAQQSLARYGFSRIASYSCNKINRLEFDRLYNFFLTQVSTDGVSVRGETDGIDEGMIDVTDIQRFKLEKSSLNELDIISDYVDQLRHQVEASQMLEHVKFSHSSLYLYKEGFRPRCLHCDTLRSPHYKVFLYLCEIGADSGPYVLVPGSNKAYIRKTLSLLSNFMFGSDMGQDLYDMTLFSSSEAIEFTGDVGDVFITDQSAVHGDMPPLDREAFKIILVLNYR